MKFHQVLLLIFVASVAWFSPVKAFAQERMQTAPMEVVVHRGANHLAPENTVASALVALEHGATWIELDVRKSKDNVLYNLHDETLDRTTNGKGLIGDALSADIDKLDAGSWFASRYAGTHVPRIAEMLDSLQGKANVFFDVKRGTPVADLVELVRRKGFQDKSFFWFADPRMLEEFVKLAPEMKVKVNASDIEGLEKWMKVCTPSYVEVETKHITPAFRTFCRKHRIRIMAAIQNGNETAYRDAIMAQPDLVNLDQPELFASVLRSFLLPYVDTRVGTAPSTTHTAGLFGKNTEEYGQTLPAVLEPNGMNFWTPQTQDTELKCKAPYYYKHDKIQGFRNSHWIVGGCTQDYGSMTLMPLTGALKCQPEARASRFTHEEETATPAYYAVTLSDYDIQAEMTGRSRSAIFRFTYPQTDEAWLVVNTNSDEGMGTIEIDTLKKQIRGCNPVHRIYQGLGEEAGYSGYFVLQYENEIEECGTFRGDSLFAGCTRLQGGMGIGAYIRFRTDGKKPVLLKVASSFTDMEGAQRNLDAEIPHWDFDRTRSELTDIWQQRLGQVQVQTDSREAKEKFYGALYRASFLPRVFSDVDGRYPSFATGTPLQQMPEGQNYYEDYSMWDTYRALHPLVNLLTPQRAGEMMQSLVLKYEQGGWLPIFPCWNSYTAAMIGDHCIAALGDAYVKGVRNFDIDKAYEGMRQNAFRSPDTYEEYANGMGRRALASYLKHGYIPLEDSVKEAFHTCEQVSRTLEYAYDDFVLAQVAKALGHTEDYAALTQRARNYRHVIDPSTGYAQGRRADGTFLSDKGNAFSFARFITEGAPCHYTWYVPHDVYGLMDLMSGQEHYVSKLDSMFSQRRYWHGNEPCHQVAYLFNYAGQPWKTQRAVRHIMQTEYLNAPGGLSGNDDAGQMSAWYVFSALGFYPVCPGTPYYMIGSPTFERAEIHLENGRTFTVIAREASEQNIYIQSARLNGKAYNRNYLSHEDIVSGGTLEFLMGPEPNSEWGADKESLPPSVL